MKLKIEILLLLAFLFVGNLRSYAQQHPSLLLTNAGVLSIREKLGTVPLFDSVLEETIQAVDAAIQQGIDVPIPKDMAGGYTHERHKGNFFLLQKAGVLFQITQEEKYAIYVRDMLLKYAEMYPTLGLHPTNKSYATGKIFWQCLNDANWLVYTSQAYDCIYDWLRAEDRQLLERNLFRPLADFLSVGNPQFFNRIHNHSTWACAAVGMIGLVMNDEVLLDRALYGLKADFQNREQQDNDGGFILIDGQMQAGFLAQLDYSFSPDGYFTEGPYYLRYAMTPFLLFAKALANNQPALNIFQYRDSILHKAVFALLELSDARGVFFPINDAQKGMSWNAREVVAAVDIAYLDFGRDPRLLSIAQLQETVLLDESGFEVAADIANGKAKFFQQKSIEFVDGADGKKGGVGVLRTGVSPDGELCVVMKYGAHGMGHGHFDKLSYSLYDELGEIVQDYGAARWVNIDQKGGGRYLPENNTWAKQSIAHNTLVVDENSQYEGKVALAEAQHPERYFFSTKNDSLQVMSAKDRYAYPGVELQRTIALIKDSGFDHPIVLDIFRTHSEEQHQYDLPLWFQGHLLSASFDYETNIEALHPLGEKHGYQHLWKEASGNSPSPSAQVTWFSNGRFYTATQAVAPQDELIFVRLGANDPNFNLRHDPALIVRKKENKNALFVSLIEDHGRYNPVNEIPQSPYTQVATVEVIYDAADYTLLAFKNKNSDTWIFAISNQDASENKQHQVLAGAKKYSWTGPYQLIKEKTKK